MRGVQGTGLTIRICVVFAGFVAAVVLLFAPIEANQQQDRASKSVATESAGEQTSDLRSNNPLFPEMRKIASEYGVDVSFTRNVTTLEPYDRRLYEDSLNFPIFCRERQSLDVILIGDSTLAWGVIPRVIEQLTGLKVGMFAFRSMYLNQRSMATARRIKDYYLKKGGLTIFGFDLWTQMQDPYIFRRGELLKLEQLTAEEFEEFARKRVEECRGTVAPGASATARRRFPRGGQISSVVFPFSQESFQNYRSLLANWKRSFTNDQIGLREWPIARDVRDLVNPPWSKSQVKEQIAAKSRKTNEETPEGDSAMSLTQFRFLKWDNDTLTLVGPFKKVAVASGAPANDRLPITENQKTNAEALVAIPGRKAFLITFYPEETPYIKQRSIHRILYPELELIDLGLLQTDVPIPMDDEDHPANIGGFRKSIMIAQWLRQNFATTSVRTVAQNPQTGAQTK